MKKKFWIPFLVLLAFKAIAGEEVGRITEFSGKVEIIKPNNVAIKAQINLTIEKGDLIKTYENGKVKIWFKDESIMSIAPNSQLKINELVYNPGVERKSFFNLMHGKVKAVVGGWFSSRAEEQYQMQVLSSVAGVRGTTFIAEVKSGDSGKEQAIFKVIEGRLLVWSLVAPRLQVEVNQGYFVLVPYGEMPTLPQQIPPAEIEGMEKEFQTDNDGDRQRMNKFSKDFGSLDFPVELVNILNLMFMELQVDLGNINDPSNMVLQDPSQHIIPGEPPQEIIIPEFTPVTIVIGPAGGD